MRINAHGLTAPLLDEHAGGHEPLDGRLVEAVLAEHFARVLREARWRRLETSRRARELHRRADALVPAGLHDRAARSRVALFFLSEAALLGLLGGLAGGAAGLVAGRLLGSGVLGVSVPLLPVLLPFAALLGLAVAVLASVAPVARALERYPAEILKRATA